MFAPSFFPGRMFPGRYFPRRGAAATSSGSWLTAPELASMRAVMTSSFPDRATIWRNDPVSDGAGGQTDHWAARRIVACRLVMGGAQEAERGGRLAAISTWRAYLPYDLRPRDRLRIGGTDYEVTETDASATERLCVTASLIRIGG